MGSFLFLTLTDVFVKYLSLDDFQVFLAEFDLIFDLGLIGQMLRLAKSVANPSNEVASAKKSVTLYSNSPLRDTSYKLLDFITYVL